MTLSRTRAEGCREPSGERLRGGAAVRTPREWCRLLLGLLVTYAVFVTVADRLASTRGESGITVAVAVLVTLLLVERLLFATRPVAALHGLGFGTPKASGLMLAAGLGMLLLLILIGVAAAWRLPLQMTGDWPVLVPGLFAQAGVAEETLFRAYLFGHLRASRPFWRAAGLAMLPFAVVHGSLFLTMAWPVASAALLLSMAIAVPLARLFELGGATIWAPALLHAIIQGTLKVVVVPEDSTVQVALVWMMAATLVPLLALLRRPRRRAIAR